MVKAVRYDRQPFTPVGPSPAGEGDAIRPHGEAEGRECATIKAFVRTRV